MEDPSCVVVSHKKVPIFPRQRNFVEVAKVIASCSRWSTKTANIWIPNEYHTISWHVMSSHVTLEVVCASMIWYTSANCTAPAQHCQWLSRWLLQFEPQGELWHYSYCTVCQSLSLCSGGHTRVAISDASIMLWPVLALPCSLTDMNRLDEVWQTHAIGCFRSLLRIDFCHVNVEGQVARTQDTHQAIELSTDFEVATQGTGEYLMESWTAKNVLRNASTIHNSYWKCNASHLANHINNRNRSILIY